MRHSRDDLEPLAAVEGDLAPELFESLPEAAEPVAGHDVPSPAPVVACTEDQVVVVRDHLDPQLPRVGVPEGIGDDLLCCPTTRVARSSTG